MIKDKARHTEGLTATWLRGGITAGLWLVAVGGGGYWALQLSKPPLYLQAQTAGSPVVLAGALAAHQIPHVTAVQRVLGYVATVETPFQTHQRFELLGVVANTSGAGSVLIAVDGAPPRAFMQGQIMTDAWTVLSVQERSAILQQNGGRQVQVSLPPVDQQRDQ